LHQNSLQVASPACSFQLDTLVENMGRINFGNYLLNNTKDSTKSVRLGGQEVKLAHVQLTLRQCPSRS
jgi:beta-galactosidase